MKQLNVPELRFPQFNGAWERRKVAEILERVSRPVDVVPEQKYREIGIRSHGKGIFHKEPVTGASLGDKRVFWVVKGALVLNIVFAWEQAVTATTDAEVGMIASHRFPMYLPVEGKASIDYLRRFFLTKKGKALLELASPGGAGRNKTLGQKEFENLKFFIPTLPEQNKIAAFLTAIDNKLQALLKAKSLLEAYKKGVMQQIFSQELRFKDEDGKDFENWQVKRFSDLYSFKITNSFSRDNLNYENGVVRNIHYGDIHTKFHAQFVLRNESVPFINSEISLKRIAKENYCKAGDLVIADASEDLADVGKCIEIIDLNNQKLLAGLHTILARPDLSQVVVGFGSFLLKSPEVRRQIEKVAQGTKVASISAIRLSDITFRLPSKKEQAKIVRFLSGLDDRLAHYTRQIALTQNWKKGLIQKMFY